MSDAVFPTLPGLKWNIKRAPIWKTLGAESVSGKELSVSLMTYPRRRYTLSYELLRAGALAELEQLEGFFNLRHGKHDTWLYNDPDDNAVTNQSFGTGNGTTTSFPLARTRGGFTEPVQSLNGAPSIYKTDWQGEQLQCATARTNLLTYSEQFDHADWQKSGVTVLSNQATAPDGTATMDAVTFAAAGGSLRHAFSGGVVTYTLSFWAQAAAGDTVTLGLDVSDSPSSTIVVTDVPQRYSVTLLDGGGGSFVDIQKAAGATDKTVYMWGGQLEAGAFATSYIPTTSAAVTVTDYTISALGVVVFTAAPANGGALTWSGSYYWRCKFLQDVAEFDQFLKDLWQLQRIEFRTVKL